MTRTLRLGLALAVAALLAVLPWAVEQAATPPAARVLQQARFAETVDVAEPALRALPHRWQADCSECRTVWYRFDLTFDEPPRDALAIYLPAAARNAALYLNGRLLSQGGRFSEPMARLGQRPLWALAPASVWVPGENRLYVLVKAATARAGFIAAPALGPEAELGWAYRVRVSWVQTLPQLAATAAAIVAVIMGLIWFYRRHESAYAALAVASAAFVLQAGCALVAEPPWPALPWDAWLAWLALLLAMAVWWLVERLSARELARPLRIVFGAMALAVALALVVDGSGRVSMIVPPLSSLALALAGARLAWAGWRGGDARLGVAGWVLALLAAADAWRALPDPAALPWQPWALAVLLAIASWMLLLRFVETLNTAELLNIDLEALVHARTAELQAQFQRVADLERRQTIAAERERLMRDMHDGVGGHLVSLLAMIEADRRRPGELATAVRDALDDMRLMIDSLEPVDDDLNAVLAMWHDRLAPRLRLANVTLHWDVALLPAVPGLTPGRVLHVLRILQEALTNAIRHGRARTLWLSAGDVEAGVRIVLRDDGSGFDAQALNGGRGLKNMRRRAADIGASLDIASAPGQGCTLTLVLPRA